MKINKTASLTSYLASVANDVNRPSPPDCSNRHPGTGWSWSPSQTATKAAPRWAIANCWHGSGPTPGTQMVTGLALLAREWERVWDSIPRDGGIYEINGVDWQFTDDGLRRA